MPKLSTAELKAVLQAEKSDALSGMNASKLSEERSDAMDYFLGDMTKDMPAAPDRSKAVSTDVADTVEGLMPSLMEIFAAGEEVVRFEPVGLEDEPAAEQETDYVNHVFMQKNPGFLILYCFIKDALLQKNGFVKVWWDKSEKEERETYLNLGEDTYALVVADPTVEVAEHTVNEDGTHDVTLVTRKDYACARVEGVPPEEFGIARRAKNIQDSGYCFHETTAMQADLIAEGYDKDAIKKLPTGTASQAGSEKQARDTVDESGDESSTSFKNDANRPIKVTEHYIRMDYEGDGKARLYRVKTAGETDNILVLSRDGVADIEPIDVVPFASMSPFIMPHRFFGRSVADVVMDIQRIKTALERGLLDNLYLANNQRIEISETHAGPHTIDDLLNNRPGGLVRTKTPGGLLPIPNQEIGSFAYPMIEYMDATREWRTGVTRQGQGLDPNSLQNVGENAILDAANAARAKTKLIARIFAETGIRDMFSILHATIRKNDREINTVKLRNKWVAVNPRGWKTRDDMTINVGLGSGSREQQIGFLMNVLGIQKEAMMLPQSMLVEPGNIYNTLKKVVELGGLKSVEPYFTDPKAPGPDGQPKQPPPPPPDPKMVEVQGKLKLQEQESQMTLQADQQKAQTDAQIEMAKLQAEMALKREQLQAEMALKREQISAELAMQQRQFDQKLALDRELGHANVQSKERTAKAATSDVHVGGDPG